MLKPRSTVVGRGRTGRVFNSGGPINTDVHLDGDCKGCRLELISICRSLSLARLSVDDSTLFCSPYRLRSVSSSRFGTKGLCIILGRKYAPRRLGTRIGNELGPLKLGMGARGLGSQLDGRCSDITVTHSVACLVNSLVLLTTVVNFLEVRARLF